MSSSKKVDGNGPQLDGITQKPAAEETAGAGRTAPSLTPETETNPYLNRVAEECVACKTRVERIVSSMVHNSTLAEDIVAEAIRRVYANAKLHRNEEEIENVAGMLTVTARRLVIDYKREKAIADRVRTVSFDDEPHAAEVNASDQWASANETLARISMHETGVILLKGMTDDERTLFRLLIQEKSTKDIAEALNVSTVTVRNRTEKLQAKLRSKLGDLM